MDQLEKKHKQDVATVLRLSPVEYLPNGVIRKYVSKTVLLEIGKKGHSSVSFDKCCCRKNK